MTYSVNFANYTIGEAAYQNVREVCRHYGKKALLIGGELALKAGKEKLVQALSVVYKEDGNFDSFYFYDKLVPRSVS